MARPEERGIGAVVSATSKTQVVKTPAATVLEDPMLMEVLINSATATASCPGWTILGEGATTVGEFQKTILFWRPAAAAGEKEHTVTFKNEKGEELSVYHACQIYVVKNADAAQPFPVCEVNAVNAASKNMKVKSATPPRAECMSILFVGIDQTGTGTPPESYVEKQDNTVGCYICRRENIAKEATGEKTIVLTEARSYVSFHVIVQPASTTEPAVIPLQAASGTSSATLAMKAKTLVALQSADGTSSATASLAAKTVVPLAAASGSSSATLALVIPAKIPLQAANGTSSATLALLTKATIALSSAAGSSSATVALTAKTVVPLASASGASSASLALRAPTTVTLGGAGGSSSATLALRAPTPIDLAPAGGDSSATLALHVPTPVTLNPVTGTSSATLKLTIKMPKGLYIAYKGDWVKLT